MPQIEKALKEISRRDFIPADTNSTVDIDRPVPIGYGQTNSQPSTVRRMLEWLDPQPSDKVLDVGSGSGWTTALLSYLVEPKGFVYAVEKVSELVGFGKENCKKLGIKNAKFYQAGDEVGLPEHAPYDRILVSAAATEVPDSLLGQLKPGGTLVIPVKYDILVIKKSASGETHKIAKHRGFIFVPLT